jgi:hypothetical protein
VSTGEGSPRCRPGGRSGGGWRGWRHSSAEGVLEAELGERLRWGRSLASEGAGRWRHSSATGGRWARSQNEGETSIESVEESVVFSGQCRVLFSSFFFYRETGSRPYRLDMLVGSTKL